MKSRVSKSALWVGYCVVVFVYVSVFGYKRIWLGLFRVGESGLFLSTSIVPCLKSGEPFLLASTWETQMHLVLSVKT